MTVAHRQHRTSGRDDEKMVARHKQTLVFVVMDALANVLESEVLILHCHENGDCHVKAAAGYSNNTFDCDRSSTRAQNDALKLPVFLRLRLMTWGRCHRIQERVSSP